MRALISRLVALCCSLALCLLGCSAATPERAEILHAQIGADGARETLEVEQHLRFSAIMLEALSNGIALHLRYELDGCDDPQAPRVVLTYSPLTDEYELQRVGAGESSQRRFARRSALLAALRRVRLPVTAGSRDCADNVRVSFDLAALPTPLRLPALIDRADWALQSAPFALLEANTP